MQFKIQKDITLNGNHTENAILTNADIVLIGHFGNTVSLILDFKSDEDCKLSPLELYNSTKNIGYILKTLYKLLDLSEENGKRLSEVKDVPCRLIFDGEWRCVGIGNFLKDKFVYFDDLMKAEEV